MLNIKIKLPQLWASALFSLLIISCFSAFAAPSISFSYGEDNTSIERINAPEAIGFIQLTATLSEVLTRDVTFSFLLAGGGSADQFKDYSFPREVTGDDTGRAAGAAVTIKAGETIKKFRIVFIIDDILDEPEESIFISLLTGDVALEQRVAKIYIADDETKPVVVLSAPGLDRNLEGGFSTAINEDDGGVSLKLTFADEENRSSRNIIVKYTINQPEGVSEEKDFVDPGLSYSPFIKGSLTIPAENNEFPFIFAISPDTIPENQETLTFTLTSAKNGIIHATHNTITILINDDDANAGAINDTGVTTCYNDTQFPIPCDGSTGFPAFNQDGEQFSRNDFEKLNSQGNVLNSTATNANCVFDKNTNLVWQLKTDSYTYTWLNKIDSVNGGNEGFEGSDGTFANVCGDGNNPCNTAHYADVLNRLRSETSNSIGLCNITNWRLPKLSELLSIIDFEPDNEKVLIDDDFFNIADDNNPGTTPVFYWTSTPAAVSKDYAWCVFFGKFQNNHIRQCLKTEQLRTRMVATCTPPQNSNGSLRFPDRPC